MDFFGLTSLTVSLESIMRIYQCLSAVLILCACEGLVAASQQKSSCQNCVTFLTDIPKHQAVANSSRSVQDRARDVCLNFAATQKSMCEAILQTWLPKLDAQLQNPVRTCGDLSVCNRTESVVVATSENADELNCQLCEYVMSMIKEQLDDPETEADLLAQAAQLCGGLPGDAKTQCLQYIAEYGKQVFEWVHKEKPEEMCVTAGFCPAASLLAMYQPQLSGFAKTVFPVQKEDQCNTCQLVILEASSVLSDPESQKEVLDYIKQSCKDFQAFADQCATYIDLYGPLVLNMAKQYLKPELCTQLGFCKAAELPRAVSAA